MSPAELRALVELVLAMREPMCECGHVLSGHSRRRMICRAVRHCGCKGWTARPKEGTQPMTTTTPLTREVPEHTCHEGPLCAQMTRYIEVHSSYADDPISRMSGIYPEPPADVTECEHLSCLALVHEGCYACQIETMNEVHELLAGDPWTQHHPTEEGTQS